MTSAQVTDHFFLDRLPTICGSPGCRLAPMYLWITLVALSGGFRSQSSAIKSSVVTS